MKEVMKSLCKSMNGFNFTEYENQIIFDFYSHDGNAIFTMATDGNKIYLADDVEYYGKDFEYTGLTLKEFAKLKGEK